MLEGIEKSYCDACIKALLDANETLLDTTVDEAINKSHVWRKGDTLGLDQIPENSIARAFREFDSRATIISEEFGEFSNPLANGGPETVQGARTFIGCDPFDRSSQACAFIKKHAKDGQRVGDLVLNNSKIKALWEEEYGGPATITGASSAITCVRRGCPIGTAILNLITQELFLGCKAGFYYLKLTPKVMPRVDTDYLRKNGKKILFPPTSSDCFRRIVTFLGKPERGYPQNFDAINLVNKEELSGCLHHKEAGGPLRILYLSSLQPSDEAVGVIAANGEKFGEWIHWLSFTNFARRPDDPSMPALRVFEISQDQSYMRDGYLMMPSPIYSVFQALDGRRVIFNVDMLRRLDNPSRYRATLIVIHSTNKWAISRIEQYGYREINF